MSTFFVCRTCVLNTDLKTTEIVRSKSELLGVPAMFTELPGASNVETSSKHLQTLIKSLRCLIQTTISMLFYMFGYVSDPKSPKDIQTFYTPLEISWAWHGTLGQATSESFRQRLFIRTSDARRLRLGAISASLFVMVPPKSRWIL